VKKLNLRLFRLIKHTKGQFIAVTMIVMIGLMTYVALSTNIENLEGSVNHFYETSNYADIFVELVKVPKNKINALYKIDGIEEVDGRIVHDVPLKVQDKNEKVNVRIISVAPDNEQINSLYLRDGSLIRDDARDVLVIDMFGKTRGIDVGDTIRPQIAGRNYNMTVAGRVSTAEYIYLIENAQTLLPDLSKFGILFVSERFAENSFGLRGSYNQVLIRVKDVNEIERIMDDVEKALDRFGIRNIYERHDQLSSRMVYEEIRGNKEMSGYVPLIYLGVAGLIIAVMIGRIVKNNRVAIGVLKAMGYTNFDILMHYTKYSFFVGVVGGGLGILSGAKISTMLASLYTETFFDIPTLVGRVYPEYVMGGMGIASVFTIAAGLWGARKVIQIHPAESMRPEAPKLGRKIFLDKFVFLWSRINFSWKIVLRNVFRSKRRFIFIALGIALTYAIALIPIFMLEAFDMIMDVQFGEFQNMDYSVNFRAPINEDGLVDLKGIIDVDDIEGKLEIPFELVHGWREKTVTVIGLNKDTVFYNFRDVNDERTYVPDKGIALTVGLARYLGVGKGDFIKMKTYLPGREDLKVEVREIIQQSLGLNAYMEIGFMQEHLADKELITGAMINTELDLKEELEKMKNVGSVQTLLDLMAVFEEFLALTIMSIVTMMFFVGALGFTIVYNTTIMSINERLLEFSSLRVMGFGKNEIFSIILRENMVMGIIGIILGIPIGNYFIYSMGDLFNTELYSFSTDISAGSYVVAGVLTIIFALLAQLATYGKIRRLDFIDALKNRTT